MTILQSVPPDVIHPFDSLESALEFMVLLEEVIGDVSLELRSLLATPNGGRCRMGLDLAIYKIQQLSANVQSSRRILNDLLMIRRVLAAQPVAPASAEPSCDASEVTMGGAARPR